MPFEGHTEKRLCCNIFTAISSEMMEGEVVVGVTVLTKAPFGKWQDNCLEIDNLGQFKKKLGTITCKIDQNLLS